MPELHDLRLDGKVALVTGGAGILGQRFCTALARAGAQVAVVDVDVDAAKRIAEPLGKEQALGIGCDVADPDAVQSCVDEVVRRFGQIDILLNNAATKTADVRAFFAPFEEYELRTWRQVMAVNIDGMFLMAQRVGRQMLTRGKGGAMVQISSIYGLVGPDQRIYEGSHYLGGAINTPPVYAASKAAVVGLTRYLATHWGAQQIRVNCLAPGGVESGQNNEFSQRYAQRVPLGRMAHEDDIVSAAVFLASDQARYITGQVLAVDGGLTAW